MKHIILSALITASLPQMAFANDDVYDTGPTERCLSAAETNADKRACIGQAAEACADLSLGGFTTRSMTGCLVQELAFFDAMLNVEYQRVRGLAQKFHTGDSASLDDVSMVDRLVQMQRAWMSYRDATCAYEERQFDGGTLGRLVFVDCMATLTAEQAFRLQDSVLGL